MNLFFFILILLLFSLMFTRRAGIINDLMRRITKTHQGWTGMETIYAALTVFTAIFILLGTALAVSFSAMMKGGKLPGG